MIIDWISYKSGWMNWRMDWIKVLYLAVTVFLADVMNKKTKKEKTADAGHRMNSSFQHMLQSGVVRQSVEVE